MKKEMLINVLQPEECRIAIVEDGIQLKISKHDVQELPTLQVDHPNA